MAAMAQTLAEARDHILKRLGAENSTKMQSLVLTLLNHALVYVSSEYDWKYLRAVLTATIGTTNGFDTTHTTGIAWLPTDLDRVLVLHQSGEDEFLTELDPIDFEMAKENDSITKPSFWCVYGYAQATTTQAPRMKIELYKIPSSGSVYTMWYIKRIDELTSSANDEVPNLPLAIWDLVIRKATLEGMKMLEFPNTVIDAETRHFLYHLNMYKKREDKGSSKYPDIRHRSEVANHYTTRMK